jgi:hypothetical protein
VLVVSRALVSVSDMITGAIQSPATRGISFSENIMARTSKTSLIQVASLCCSAFAGVGVTSAATIDWSTATNISSGADVATTGTLVDALYCGPSGTTQTVGATSFTGATFVRTDTPDNGDGISSQDGTTNAPIAVTGNFQGGANTGYFVGGPGVSPSSYNSILSYLGFESGGDNFLTFSLNGLITGQNSTPNLVVGDNYEVQIWVYQPSGGSNGASIVDGPTLSSSGEFATGTFTADSSGQTFELSNPNGAGIFDAIQLRDLGSSTPEPATCSLVVLAVGGSFLRRHRRASV